MPDFLHGPRILVRALTPAPWRYRVYAKLANSTLLRKLYESRKELDLIDAELAALSSTPWQEFRSGSVSVGMTERVVEIPWVLSRYSGENRVLDVGSAYGNPLYLRRLAKLGIPELHGIDLVSLKVPGVLMSRADVRELPYADDYFELIHCISTIEHIGRDNARYNLHGQLEGEGDAVALREMERVLKKSGRILITIPFGRLEYHDWFKQYDLPAWEHLVSKTGLRTLELAIYRYASSGWSLCPKGTAPPTGGYEENGALGATAVLCASLTR